MMLTESAYEKISEPSELPQRTVPICSPVGCLLAFILLVFASQYGFSFERGGLNTEIGASAQGLVSAIDSGHSTFLKIQTYSVYLLCTILMFRLISAIARDFIRFKAITALLAFTMCSAAWSQNPKASLTSSVFVISNTAFAFYLQRRFSPNDILKLLVFAGTIAALGCLIVVAFFPQYGIQSRNTYAQGAWQGIFGQKNICGAEMTFLLLPIFFVQLKSKFSKNFRPIYGAVMLLIIAMTRSAGAYVICGLCILFIAALKLVIRMKNRDAALTLMIGAVAAVAIGVALYGSQNEILAVFGKDATLTGRTTIWSVLIQSALKRPFIGFGYMAFWQGFNGESLNVLLAMHWTGISYAENGVLELWLQLGAIGVLLFLMIYLSAVRDSIRCLAGRPTPPVLWYTSVLFLVAISNVEGGKLMFPSDLETIIPMLAFVGLRSSLRCRLRSN